MDNMTLQVYPSERDTEAPHPLALLANAGSGGVAMLFHQGHASAGPHVGP